jgi:hypothetical protein
MLQRLLTEQLLVLERRVFNIEDIKGYINPEEILREHKRILKYDNWYETF